MPWTEAELKNHLKEALPARLYLLYGKEPYLTTHYTDQIVRLAMGKDAESDPLGQFNLQRFDGQDSSFDVDRRRRRGAAPHGGAQMRGGAGFDVTGGSVPFDRVMELAGDPPEDTVLIFWMDTVLPDGKKTQNGGSSSQLSKKTEFVRS